MKIRVLNLEISYKRIAAVIIFLYLVWPLKFAVHYSHIDHHDILGHLIRKTTNNVTKISSTNPVCDYSSIIEGNKLMYTAENREQIHNDDEIHLGGEYYPKDCAPSYSTAIIVVYRNREEQLRKFLIYMHNFLRQQRIHYRIFLVEQYDQKPFNRAKLFNIGVTNAIKYEFPCVILHDVDLFPLSLGNIYACTEQPRHMCASLDLFRFNLPYHGLFGGVSAIDVDTFQTINGMSNLYSGWGGEDDDLYERLHLCEFDVCRFEPNYSQYTMLKHKKEKPNENRNKLLISGTKRYKIDGLNTLNYTAKGFKLEKLYTHILVEI